MVAKTELLKGLDLFKFTLNQESEGDAYYKITQDQYKIVWRDLIDRIGLIMAAIPCAAFSARKIHENILREQARTTSFPRDETGASSKQKVTSAFTPPKYNDKLMNSIWGLYNRYAPPAFQKNFENPSQCSELAAPKTKIFGLF